MEFKKYKIVEIEWIDAQAGFGQATFIEDLIQSPPLITHSIGYLLHEDKEKVILGFMLFGEDTVKHSQLIPKGIIIKITHMNRKTKQ